MASTTQTPPPLSIQLVTGVFTNRVWANWFTSLFNKLGGAQGIGKFYLSGATQALNSNLITYTPVPANCNLTSVYVCNQFPMGNLGETIIIGNTSATTIGTINIPAFAQAGSVHSTAIANNNTFSPGDKVLVLSGNLSSNTGNAVFTLTFTY